jgi:uncharacterized protein (DUF2147 family)
MVSHAQAQDRMMFIQQQADRTIAATNDRYRIVMKKILAPFALLLLVTAASSASAADSSIEGRWSNPKGSVVVHVAPCGDAYCGHVVSASARAQANAREAGTPRLVGTQILSGLKPDGKGSYKGKVFVPKRNIHASATVRAIGRNSMSVTGCAIAGLICDNQTWTRVGS